MINKITNIFLFLLLAVKLSAANVTVTNSITYYDHLDSDSWFTDSTNTFYVPHFNPQIGTLVKADVYVKMNITNSFYAENRSMLSRGEYFTNFVGVIGVTNQSTFSFGNQIQYLNRTNYLVLDTYDGVTDYAGTSGGRTLNVINEVFVLQPSLGDVVGYKVWSATNNNSARATMYFYSGSFRGGVRTTAGLDLWVVYTYVNQYTCPDCDDDDDDDCDKDRDKDRDKDKNKDCDNDRDRNKNDNKKSGRK